MMYPRIILFILLPLFGFSQAPQKINFQSILRNSGGEVVSNKAVSLRISILSGSINDSTVYSETHTKTTDASGLISIQIGGGRVVSGIFGNISWGNAAHFIKLEADFNGGSNYGFLGTQEIMSVPYALYAGKTDTSVLNLANRFNSKVNASDTASMLINYRNELKNKLNTSDTFFMLSNYWTGLNNKVSFSDTATMLNPYLKKADVMVNVETDPVFNTSIAKGITGIDTAYWNRKLNPSDTASMLAPYFLDADTTLLNMEGRLSTKVSFSDTANMLNPYLKKADAMVNVETDPVYNSSIAKGITGIDTAYWNRKLNPSDTASMLTNYLRKSDAIIADLQNQDKLLQSLTNVVDIDGNSYKTLKIGQQTWMAENLKTTKYKNGEAIPTGLTDVAWSSTTNGAYAIYNNDVANDSMYGKLYNWYAVADSRGLCPAGWHVPTDAEWTILTDHLGGLSVAGGKMKVKGTTYWNSPNAGATNESGFGALPGGDRDYLAGQFGGINHLGYFWSSTELDQNLARRPVLYKEYEFVYRNQDPKRDGFSVRCLKDSETDINQGLNMKLNISDTAAMLNPYLKKADAMVIVETDPVFNTSIAKGITGIDTAYWNRKLNPSDTASMLAPYFLDADTTLLNIEGRLSTKVSFSDTANMLNPYLKKADVLVNVETDPVFNTSIAKGITGIDTAYWNRKLNPADTASMLTNYLRKSDAIIDDLQNQDKLLQSLTNVVDIDGNSYRTLKIGQQTWMAENLKTTKYKNGEAIPTGLTDVAWSSTTNGAYAIYNNDVVNDSIYGKLYNWYAVADSGGLCPTGWHVPSLDDWTILADHLGGLSVAGGKMKVKGTTYWNSDNVGATNESGFGVLPGGDRDYLAGQFGGINHLGYFWSSTEVTETPIRAVLFKQYEFAQFGGDPKRDGFSVRCLKDSETDVNQGLNLKLNVSDTANMLNPYLKKADVMVNVETDPVFNTSIAKGITGIDTAYWNRKLNPADTASMLTNYLRKSDAIIDDLQNQNKILQNLAKVTDADGNSYKTVKIGNQIWMAENLKTSKYQNGNSITTNLDDQSWSTATSGAFAIYANNPTFDTSYGKLYNWYAVSDNRGICPLGWHVPSQAEFIILREYLGGASVAGGKLKLTGTTFWLNPNINATNESGFSAVGGGTRNSGGSYSVINQIGFFWSSTENMEFDVVNNGGGTGLSVVSFKTIGYSVRCLKNAVGDLNQSLNLKLNISDTSTMLNPYLKKTDAIVNVETDPIFNTSIAKGITGIDTAYWNRKTGNTIGNIQYWNGTGWVNLAPGQDGQTLILVNGIPSWSGAAYPSLTTSSISSITSTSAGVGGNISSDGGASVSARGLVYGTASNPTLSNTVLSIGSGTGGFSETISGLTPNATYYVRAYATNSAGTGYGNEVSFQTLPVAVPTLITTDASGITQTTVTSGGTISNDGGATITERGIVYGTSTNPTTSNTKVSSGSGTGSFSVNVTSLTPNTTYFIRSYAINSAGTGYGNNITFQTTVPAVPSLTTRELLNITNTTATGGGSITNGGGSSVTAKGICWGTSPNPTTLDSKTTDGTGTATFTSFITGLSASVTYYVRAYATNSTGTGYGNQQTFTASSTSNTLPVVTSTSVTGLTTIQATFNAEVNSQGGGTVTERGAVWNTSGNPTVNSNRIPSGSGTGVYTTTITGLSGGSNYYVRAYAINNFGISYGVEISFSSLFSLATLTTNNVIAQITTASSGGNITDNGGSTVTARGVVWNTTGTPTISDSRTTDGLGTGSYVSNMTALNPSTTYFVRAYATNSMGTSYGNEQTFTTTATSQTVTDIDGNTYNTVQIGSQVWMSENLKTSRYRNGGSIPYVVGNSDWQALTTGAWSYYDHDAANNAVYGKLYNWYSTQGDTLCPTGWGVPTDAEWSILTDYLGGESVAGGKMISITTDWNELNTGATNESGFSVLPVGYRGLLGSFQSFRYYGVLFWSATEGGGDTLALHRILFGSSGTVFRLGSYKGVGGSIRCLKD